MIPASNFMATIAANVDNEKLSDAEFRQMIRNTLPIVEYDNPSHEGIINTLTEENEVLREQNDSMYGQLKDKGNA